MTSQWGSYNLSTLIIPLYPHGYSISINIPSYPQLVGSILAPYVTLCLLWREVAGPAEVLRDDVANLDMFSAEEKQQLANSFWQMNCPNALTKFISKFPLRKSPWMMYLCYFHGTFLHIYWLQYGYIAYIYLSEVQIEHIQTHPIYTHGWYSCIWFLSSRATKQRMPTCLKAWLPCLEDGDRNHLGKALEWSDIPWLSNQYTI